MKNSVEISVGEFKELLDLLGVEEQFELQNFNSIEIHRDGVVYGLLRNGSVVITEDFCTEEGFEEIVEEL